MGGCGKLFVKNMSEDKFLVYLAAAANMSAFFLNE